MNGLELGERPEWHRRAACRGVGTDIFFPVRGQDVTVAKSYCEVCTVRTECADAGLLEREGIWGGQSERARRRLRRVAGLTIPRRPDRLDDDTSDEHEHDEPDQEDQP